MPTHRLVTYDDCGRWEFTPLGERVALVALVALLLLAARLETVL